MKAILFIYSALLLCITPYTSVGQFGPWRVGGPGYDNVNNVLVPAGWTSMNFNSDESLIFGGSKYEEGTLIDTRTGEARALHFPYSFGGAVFTADSRYLIKAGSTMLMYDLETDNLITDFNGFSKVANQTIARKFLFVNDSIVYSPDRYVDASNWYIGMFAVNIRSRKFMGERTVKRRDTLEMYSVDEIDPRLRELFPNGYPKIIRTNLFWNMSYDELSNRLFLYAVTYLFQQDVPNKDIWPNPVQKLEEKSFALELDPNTLELIDTVRRPSPPSYQSPNKLYFKESSSTNIYRNSDFGVEAEILESVRGFSGGFDYSNDRLLLFKEGESIYSEARQGRPYQIDTLRLYDWRKQEILPNVIITIRDIGEDGKPIEGIPDYLPNNQVQSYGHITPHLIRFSKFYPRIYFVSSRKGLQYYDYGHLLDASGVEETDENITESLPFTLQNDGDQLILRFDIAKHGTSPISLSIINLQGSMILTNQYPPSTEVIIPIAHLSQGKYFLNLSLDNQSFQSSFIRNR